MARGSPTIGGKPAILAKPVISKISPAERAQEFVWVPNELEAYVICRENGGSYVHWKTGVTVTPEGGKGGFTRTTGAELEEVFDDMVKMHMIVSNVMMALP